MDATPPKLNKRLRWQYVVVGVLMLLGVGITVGEWFGWPFLGAPLERLLSENLERRIIFSADSKLVVLKAENSKQIVSKLSERKLSDTNASSINKFSIRFLGGISLNTPQLEIAAPAWSESPHMLLAQDVTLELRYIDLWRLYRAHSLKDLSYQNQTPLIQYLRIQRLEASTLDSHLERLSDGRASWQFEDKPAPINKVKQSIALPSFGSLLVSKGLLSYRDMPLETDIEAHFSFENHTKVAADEPDFGKIKTPISKFNSTLQANVTGYYRKLPLKIELVSTSQLPDMPSQPQTDTSSAGQSQASKPLTIPVAISLNAKVGRAVLTFRGGATDALFISNFYGKFNLKGPSMAAVGDLFGVTLPTTSQFSSGGFLNKKAGTWHVQVNNLDLGATHLNGNFVYKARRNEARVGKLGHSVPLLSGKLGGSKLLITDLGPAFGAEPISTNRKKVLPSRPFDLASLNVMDANVLIDIAYVDLNTSLLEPLRPLRGHLQLKEGILTLNDLDARTAQGQLKGDLSLDGRSSKALWDSNLRWGGIRLDRWVKQVREDGLPPYISGSLNGQAILKGQGKSTAEILASLNGTVHSELQEGAISHLVIEAAGLDLAQAIGVMFTGDDILPVQCAVVDLVAKQGTFRPRVMVLDTKDSAVWVDGSLSLATEELNLRAVVMPKDFSPLTLRSPLRITGTFADPEVSLEKQPIGIKVATSIVLAMINPLAALIPLLDTGDAKEAKRRADGCVDLMRKSAAKVKH